MLIHPISAHLCFAFPVQPLSVSHSTDVCTAEVKNIRNMHVLSANQISDIFQFNDNLTYSYSISRALEYESSCPEVFYKKVVLRKFAKFTGKHLCQSLFLNKVAGLRPAKRIKDLIISFLESIQSLLYHSYFLFFHVYLMSKG